MKTLRILALMLLLVSLPAFSGGDVSKDKKVDVPPVDVPEKIIIQPTPEEIHQDFPERACSSCHTQSSLDAEPKPWNHFLTTKECDKCHFSKSWVPLRIYSHLSAKYRRNSTPDDCASCHTSNSEFFAK